MGYECGGLAKCVKGAWKIIEASWCGAAPVKDCGPLKTKKAHQRFEGGVWVCDNSNTWCDLEVDMNNPDWEDYDCFGSYICDEIKGKWFPFDPLNIGCDFFGVQKCDTRKILRKKVPEGGKWECNADETECLLVEDQDHVDFGDYTCFGGYVCVAGAWQLIMRPKCEFNGVPECDPAGPNKSPADSTWECNAANTQCDLVSTIATHDCEGRAECVVQGAKAKWKKPAGNRWRCKAKEVAPVGCD